VISSEAWQMFKEAYPDRDFFDFWLEASLNFSIRSFELSWFFLQREDCDLAAEALIPRTFVKTEPPSPNTSDYDFAYASDTIENNSRDLVHIVKFSY
jgi:hypothetical protein